MGVEMMKWGIGGLICGFALACSAEEVITDPPSSHFSPLQNLQSYAVMVCIGDGFPADKVLDRETHAAARFYIEKGKLPIEAYNEAAGLAQTWLKKNYHQESNVHWTAMKCMDLMHDAALKRIVEKYRVVGKKKMN